MCSPRIVVGRQARTAARELAPVSIISRSLRLDVIAAPGPNRKAGPRYLDLDRVIFIGPLSHGSFERQSIKSVGIRDRSIDQSLNVVACVKDKTAALGGGPLQGKVTELRILRRRYRLQKLLVVEGLDATGILRPLRVNGI